MTVSSFASSDRDSAWWTYTLPDTHEVNTCASTGATVVADIRRALAIEPIAAWGPELQNALVARSVSLANQTRSYDRASADVFDGLRARLRADVYQQVVSNESLRFGIYVAYYERSGRPLSGLAVPSDVVRPPWGRVIPGGTDDGMYCAVSGRDPSPATLTADERATVRAESTTGARVHEVARGGNAVLIAIGFGILGAAILMRKQ